MGRAPCCEKMGLKKGPWTQQEDQILISYINTYGHGNWRALPKQAGLLRCGKSCRLRWTNYLRPDIKRGNFTKEEEETIISFHEMLGNRWSAIAARLPGRTDNEIKNVWHTRLKKRLNPHDFRKSNEKAKSGLPNICCSEIPSSVVIGESNGSDTKEEGFYPEIVESFWLDVDASSINSIASTSLSDCDDVNFWFKEFLECGDYENLAGK